MLAVLALMLTMLGVAEAREVARSVSQGVVVSLTDENCRMLDRVTNLPLRATWTEKGKVYDGCYTLTGTGQVLLFFDDLTAVVAPFHAFDRPM
jgi:hypothetical protein